MPSNPDPVAALRTEICVLLGRLEPTPTDAWIAAHADRILLQFQEPRAPHDSAVADPAGTSQYAW